MSPASVRVPALAAALGVSLVLASLLPSGVAPAAGAAPASGRGGKTWQQAKAQSLGGGRFRVTFTAPPSAQVSLRSTARDSAGDGLAETILGAYQTSA